MEWFVEHARAISAIDAIAELGIAFAIPIYARRRLERVHPLSLLVAAFFAIEALVSLSRATGPAVAAPSTTSILVLELLGTVSAIAILLVSARLVDAVLAVVDAARTRAAEYERARRDYSQVVRHRINNPLTVIRGAAQTLEAEIADHETRHRLRLAIIEAARVLEEISLGPERLGAEEHELDAIAHVPDGSGA